MLDGILCLFLTISMAFSIWKGTADGLSAAVLQSGEEALRLGFTLGGAMMLWGGILEIARESGLTRKVSAALRPLLGRIFARSKQDAAAMEAISMNVTANLFGLGNAATPFGLAAMERLRQQAPGDAATPDMVRFVVLNTASIQLLPTTVAVLRQSAGSAHPLEILPAVWLTSLASVAVGLLACRLLEKP